MSNKLSPLFNSTSALLEFQIWSDVTSHAIPFKSCATTVKNWFELVTASLNNVLPMWNGALHDLRWNPLFSRQMICIGKTCGWGQCVVYKMNPLHTSPFWLNIVLDVPKLKITQAHIPYTYTSQIIFFDLFTFQSESTIPDQMQFVLFCSKIVT